MSAQLKDPEWYRTVYLFSAHWRKLRTARLAFARNQCERCGTPGASAASPHLPPLDVHHLIYRNLYDVTLADLRALCRPCHERQHGPEVRSQRAAARRGRRKQERRQDRRTEARRERAT